MSPAADSPGDENLRRAYELFEAATALPPEQWASFLAERAGGAPSLVAEVIELLQCNAEGDAAFLARVQAATRAVAASLLAATQPVPTNQALSAASMEKLAQLRSRSPLTRERYAIEGEVGRGGMGAVMRVRDLDLGRNLAMKVILGKAVPNSEGGTPEVAPQLVQRFLDEAEITGKLDHPGIVPVHELGVDAEGRVYFTMRLVQGDTVDVVFKKVREEQDGWTRTRGIEVLLKVCDALAYAHQQGVLHRDLKPTNVMVGKFGEVYVMDWGLAKVLGQPDRNGARPEGGATADAAPEGAAERAEPTPLRTLDGGALGTPSYMPPEQARGHIGQLDKRADVYAIGAMLYQLLAGKAPYAEVAAASPEDPKAVLAAVKAGPPVPIGDLDRTVPAGLEAICNRAMAREPEHRYPDVGELANELRAYLDNRVIRAYRTGPAAEAALWIRRNRGMAAGLMTAVLAVLVFGTWAQTARRGAEDALASKVQADQQREKVEEEQRRQKSVANRQKAKREEFDKLSNLQREVLGTADRLEAAVAGILKLAHNVSQDPALRMFADTPLDSLHRFAVDLGADTKVDWNAWVQGYWLVVRGRAEAVDGLVAAIPAPPKKKGEKLSPGQVLLAGALHRAIAESRLLVGDEKAALQAYLDALGEFRGAAAALKLQSAEGRAGLQRLAVATAIDCARVLQTRPGLADMIPAEYLETAARKGVRAAAVTEVARQGAGADPECVVLRAARHAAVGEHLSCLADLGALPKSFAVRDLTAWSLLRLGRLENALQVLADADASVAQNHVHAMQQARCFLACNRPWDAVKRLSADLRQFSQGDFLPLCRLESLELLGVSQWSVGDLAAARESFELASKLADHAGIARRERLRLQLGHVLLQSGKSREAVAQYVGRPVSDALGDTAGLSSRALSACAVAADQAGMTAVAEEAVKRLLEQSTLDEEQRVRGVVLRASLHRRSGRFDDAAKVDAELRASLKSTQRPDLRMLAWVHLAAGQVRSGRLSEAQADLLQAADCATAGLLAFSRFQRLRVDDLQVSPWNWDELGHRALAVQAELAGAVAVAGGAVAVADSWKVVQCCQDLSLRMALARSAVAGSDPNYLRQREQLLEEHERRLASGNGILSTLQRTDLTRTEDRLRDRGGVGLAAAFPRSAALAECQKALGPTEAMVVYVPTRDRPLAFVVTRKDAVLQVLPAMSDWLPQLSALAGPKEVVQPALRRLGDAVLGPVLQAPPLLGAEGIKTILFAAGGAFGAVPLEWCAGFVAGDPDAPLIQRYDIAHVPSPSAWLDSARSGGGRQSSASRLLAMVDEVGEANRDWISAAFGSRLTAEEKQELLDLGAAPDSGRRQVLELSGRLHVHRAFEGAAGGFLLKGEKARLAAFLLPLRVQPDGFGAAGAMGTALGAQESGFIHLQDVRDLDGPPDWCLVRNTAPAASIVDEARGLSGVVQAVWAGGCQVVVTVSSNRGDATMASRLLAGGSLAIGTNPRSVSSWGDQVRSLLKAGTEGRAMMAIRLWSTRSR